MASTAEILGHLSTDRANDLIMQTPPPRDRDSEEADGARKPEVTPGAGGTGAAMARSKPLDPGESLRLISDAWRADLPRPNGGADSDEEGEYPDLRSFIWTQLVTRLQDGDPKAMEELYGMFSNGVRYHLCRQLGPEELDDRLHDAFLIVVDSIRAGELRDPRRLMGFIRTVVKRMVAATIYKQVAARRERTDEDRTANVSDRSATPEGALLFQQQTGIVREVLQEMTERDRHILTRFYVDEEEPQAICDEMGLTLTQFRLLKSRAKNRFGVLGRKKVQKSGLTQLFVRFSGS